MQLFRLIQSDSFFFHKEKPSSYSISIDTHLYKSNELNRHNEFLTRTHTCMFSLDHHTLFTNTRPFVAAVPTVSENNVHTMPVLG